MEYFREDYEIFVGEIRDFTEVLKVRIAMEDDDLFTLLDSLGGESR